MKLDLHSESGGIISILAFFLFLGATVLDFTSTAVVLSLHSSFVELNPVVSPDEDGQIMKIFRADLKFVIYVGLFLAIFSSLPKRLRDEFFIREIAILATRAILIAAFAKTWFSFENFQILVFENNVSYSTQLILEHFDLVDIDSRGKAYAFNSLIGLFVGVVSYLMFMKWLRTTGLLHCTEKKP